MLKKNRLSSREKMTSMSGARGRTQIIAKIRETKKEAKKKTKN